MAMMSTGVPSQTNTPALLLIQTDRQQKRHGSYTRRTDDARERAWGGDRHCTPAAVGPARVQTATTNKVHEHIDATCSRGCVICRSKCMQKPLNHRDTLQSYTAAAPGHPRLRRRSTRARKDALFLPLSPLFPVTRRLNRAR